MALEKVYEWRKFQLFASKKIWLSLNIWKSTKFFLWNPGTFWFFVSQCIHKESMFTIEIEDEYEDEVKAYTKEVVLMASQESL